MAGTNRPALPYFRLSGHALLRFGSAYLVDLASAALRIQEDLAGARVLTSEEEAREVLGGSRFRFHPGYHYLAGATGVYVLRENVVITYIDSSKRFRSRLVRGNAQRSRSGKLKTGIGKPRRQ